MSDIENHFAETSSEDNKKKNEAERKKLANPDPMEDKEHNTPEKNKNGFYWVPICFSFFPVFFAFAFSLPMFPAKPAIYIADNVAISTLNGYQLMFTSPLSATFFVITMISWAYIVFVGIFTAFQPKFREVKKMNLLVFPGLGALCVGTLGSLLGMVGYVSSFDNKKTLFDSGTGVLYTPFDFAEVTYWALLIVPILLLIWWSAVNITNKRLHEKESKN